MSRSADELALEADFAEQYRCGQAADMLELEREVLGSDYGATSWTTRQEAARVAELLGLGPGRRLLELGAGSGWPGVFLAGLRGCDVTLVDVPVGGLLIALGRAAADGVAELCRAVVADGAALPFRSASFDAVSHCDVLCCLPRKRATLEACRRTSRAGARMVFSVIAPAAGLGAGAHREAVDAGPPFVDVDDDYGVLLAATGWRLMQETDLTAGYAVLAKALHDGMARRAAALIRLYGASEFEERLARRHRAAVAVERGLLRRLLFVAAAQA